MKFKFAIVCSAMLGATLALATEAQAFTGWNHFDKSYAGLTNTYTVGAGYNTQAFLGGVWGNLGTTNSYVETGMKDAGLTFFLALTPNNASSENGGEAYAIYPGNVSLARNTCSNPGETEWLNKPSSGTYGCWLTGITNTKGNSWGAWTDKASVEYQLVSGVYFPLIHCYGNAEAEAQCAPYTTYVTGGGNGDQMYTTNTDLGPNSTTPGNYEACLLRSVNGVFRTNSAGAGVQAAIVFGSEWYLGTGVNTGAYVDCVE